MSLEKLKNDINDAANVYSNALEHFGDIEVEMGDIIITIKVGGNLAYLNLNFCDCTLYDTDNNDQVNLSDDKVYSLYHNVSATDVHRAITLTINALKTQCDAFTKSRVSWIALALK